MSISSAHETTTRGPEETEALAARLGAACEGGELVLLTGELGAGKTCFVRGLARGLGCDPAAVRSPSFTLLQQYAGRRTLNHFDVYFTTALADLERSGLDEALASGGVVAVEWGERFAARLPKDRLEIRLDHLSPEVRRIVLLPGGPSAEKWLARAGLPAGGGEPIGQGGR